MRLLDQITELPEGRKQALTFLLFVLVSAGIWTVNALNQVHTVKTSIALQENGRFSGADNLPESVEIELQGRGFNLIPVLSSASSFTLLQPAADSVWNIRQSLNAWLTPQGKDIELIAVQPATIHLDITKRYTRRIPITPDLKVRSANGWIQSGPEGLWPDSITIASDNPLPDSLKHLHTGIYELSIASGPYFGSHPLTPPAGTEFLESSRLWIYVPAEQATEARVKVTIRSSRKGFVTIPGSAEIQCRVPLSRHASTTADRFIVIAEPDPSDPERAVLKVLHAPYWCSNTVIQPSSVRMFRVTAPAS